MKFIKMQALGNDYIFLDCLTAAPPAEPAEAARAMSKPHFGIGSDGLVLILPCDGADAYMRMFNSDGSEGNMCGNALRCVGKYLYDHGLTAGDDIAISTPAGLYALVPHMEKGVCVSLTADMGEPKHLSTESIMGMSFDVIDAGSRHAVTFDLFPDASELARIGRLVELSFTNGLNVEFCRVKSAHEMDMRVWERGSGVTLACGTGATAAFAAAHARGLIGDHARIDMPGGAMELSMSNGRVSLTGGAEYVFTGEYLA